MTTIAAADRHMRITGQTRLQVSSTARTQIRLSANLSRSLSKAQKELTLHGVDGYISLCPCIEAANFFA